MAKVVLWSPRDIFKAFDVVDASVAVTIIDPWYNKGVGGVRSDYMEWLSAVVRRACSLSNHVFVWGFPEIVHGVLDDLPVGWDLVAWLTWYYKNCPSVIRGWRSAQQACLHLAKHSATLYPEHFLTDEQIAKRAEGKLRYMPGPSSVIEAALSIGFIGREEQTGYPAQKPVKVFEPLIRMASVEGDTIFDPMCGSGTTGAVARSLNRKAILCDVAEEAIVTTEKRLKLRRSNSFRKGGN